MLAELGSETLLEVITRLHQFSAEIKILNAVGSIQYIELFQIIRYSIASQFSSITSIIGKIG